MRSTKLLILFAFTALLLISPLIYACGSEGETEGTKPQQPDVEIIIGNLTDKTGASANAMSVIDMALADAVRYYNENNNIPGVKLKVVEYDGRYEPSNDIPGYQWLKDRGADLIYTNVPATPITLKHRVNSEKMVLFTPAANRETITPPGYIFVTSTLPEDNAYTLLKWLSENDSDFPEDRPARIGAAGWSTPYNVSLHVAMEEYANVHSEQFEWKGSYTNDLGFNWQSEVEALKDCDYIMLPIVMNNFVKQYREAGYTGKFLGTGAHVSFLGLVTDARLWDKFDGSLFILPAGWWNDDNEMVNLTKEILHEYHPDSAEKIMREGASYIAIDTIYQMLDIIRAAVEEVGPQNFDSEALYNAARSFSQTVEGVERARFGDSKRASIDYLAIYEARAAEKDLFRMHEDWYPVIRSLD
ncbi:MAG: ABC transporter substrate-binding protein [Dehalococcoidia bacterium]